MSSKPLLQLALDSKNMEQALHDTEIAANFVDIIEVGTILAISEGIKSVKTIRSLYPKHILVCDLKTTDAGSTLAQIAFSAGADWLTVSAAANIATIASCKKVADEFNLLGSQSHHCKKEIQIEIYGNWTYEDAQEWLKLGITQAIYHRSRDAELAGQNWSIDDIQKMQKLSDLGIELSITGGIVPEDIHLFKDINVKAFIAGRALTGKEGINTAKKFHQEISKYW